MQRRHLCMGAKTSRYDASAVMLWIIRVGKGRAVTPYYLVIFAARAGESLVRSVQVTRRGRTREASAP
jgi:hypothetical protein